MIDVYVNEGLGTGLNDGTSEANAYNSWANFLSGFGTTMSDDLTIHYRNTTVANANHDILNWTTNDFTINLLGYDGAIMQRGETWAEAFAVNVPNVNIWNLTFKSGRVGCQLSADNINVHHCLAIDNDSHGFGKAGVSTVNLYNCISAGNGGSGFNAASWTTMNLTNCYAGDNVGDDFGINVANVIMNLTTCASEDATGNITAPYSTATFVNVTPGIEDFHLADGSSLINAGTNTSYATDPDGETHETDSFDIGIYEKVGGAPVGVIRKNL